MSVIRLRGSLLGVAALAGLAACGQPLDENLPQNEALPDAPEGIIFLDPDGTLPPGFTIQALTAAEQATMRDTVNATRTKGIKCGTTSYPAALALALENRLVTAAEAHAKDMATPPVYFSHTGRAPAKTQPWDRVSKTGYKWSTVGENIAAGQTSIATAISGWFTSTEHCKNFMNKSFTQVGFGMASGPWFAPPPNFTAKYWVAVLAKPL